MPRANRHHISGCIWHITHRCHKQEFLLKFERDRKQLASRAQKRSIVSVKDSTVLKEPEISYSTVLGAKKGTLSHENAYSWR